MFIFATKTEKMKKSSHPSAMFLSSAHQPMKQKILN